jgi:hypothetical protein
MANWNAGNKPVHACLDLYWRVRISCMHWVQLLPLVRPLLLFCQENLVQLDWKRAETDPALHWASGGTSGKQINKYINWLRGFGRLRLEFVCSIVVQAGWVVGLVVAKVDDDLLCSRLLHTIRPNNPTSTSALAKPYVNFSLQPQPQVIIEHRLIKLVARWSAGWFQRWPIAKQLLIFFANDWLQTKQLLMIDYQLSNCYFHYLY